MWKKPYNPSGGFKISREYTKYQVIDSITQEVVYETSNYSGAENKTHKLNYQYGTNFRFYLKTVSK